MYMLLFKNIYTVIILNKLLYYAVSYQNTIDLYTPIFDENVSIFKGEAAVA